MFGIHPDGTKDGTDSLIVVDKRSIEHLTEAIEYIVRQFGSDQALGQGNVSCRIVTKLLLDRIFQSAAGDGSNKFDALEMVGLVSVPDPEIAHAMGQSRLGRTR